MARDLSAREREVQPSASILGQFVKLQFGNGSELCNEQSVPGARLEHDVAGVGLSEQQSKCCDVDRGRELLPVDLLFAPDRLRRERACKGDRFGDGRVGQNGTVRQKARHGVLEDLEAFALRPAIVGIAASKAGAHRYVQALAVDGSTVDQRLDDEV